MKRVLLFLLCSFCCAIAPFQLLAQDPDIKDTALLRFVDQEMGTPATLAQLGKKIMDRTPDNKERLRAFLFWTYRNMRPDTMRFFHPGPPLSVQQAFSKREGLCDEYTDLLSSFCKQIGVPCIRIEGYVQEGHDADDRPKDVNHSWNALFLDGSWWLCDLFWATVVLQAPKEGPKYFDRRLTEKYYLAQPSAFIDDHLPCSPIFQFDPYPITAESFFIKSDTSVERLPYVVDFLDSISKLQRLEEGPRRVRIAEQAYAYYKGNLDLMIVAHYNYAVDLMAPSTNKSTQTLKTAKKHLLAARSSIPQSHTPSIKALDGECQRALAYIDHTLGQRK